MNITSLEIAQATMDMFFCLFCLIIFVSIKANNPKQKSMGMFVRLFLIATVLYFGETLAYIYLWIFYNQFRTGNRFIRNVCCIYV